MKLGLIGVGYWGKNLARNFNDLGVLNAICDDNKENLSAVGQNYAAIQQYAGISDLLNDSAIDAVAISTPAATHGELTRRSLEADKHVFVEKPLCLDLSEANEIKQLAKARNRILMVGHMLLYHPAFTALLAAVSDGMIGKLRYIYSTRLSLGKIRREENALWSFAPHDISMILALTNALPQKIVANGEAFLREGVADTTLTHLTFESGIQAHIFVSWLHPFKDHRMVVIGTDGMIVLDDVQQGADKLLLYSHEVGWEGEIPTVNKAEGTPLPYDKDEPLRRECQHFVECVTDNVLPISDAAEGIRVLTVLDGCQRALNHGEAIWLEADG